MKKKIFIINKAQFGYHIDTYYYCKFLSDKFEVIYICFDEGKKKMILPEVKIIYSNYMNNYFIRALSFFYMIFKNYYRIKPNIVFIKYFLSSSFILTFIKRSKVVLDIRTGSVSNSIIKRKRKDKILKFEASLFKNITVISQGLKKRLKLKDTAKIIPLGAIKISKKEKSYKKIKLLYVGTFENRKIEITIKAVANFIQKVSTEISYQIVGFGSKKDIELIRRTIKDNKLDSYVSYKGRVSIDLLKEYFDRNNVGIAYIPITDYYAHQPPTKIFEYSMSGLITIATKTKINETLITDENGILCFDNAESLFEALREVYFNLPNYNFCKIVESLEDYHWNNIVKNRLTPFLNSIAHAN